MRLRLLDESAEQVLYWLLTGTTVFVTRGAHEFVLAHLDRVPERPSKRLGRDLPPDLEAIVLTCLAKEPAERSTDGRDLAVALSQCKCAGTWLAAAARAYSKMTDIGPPRSEKTSRPSPPSAARSTVSSAVGRGRADRPDPAGRSRCARSSCRRAEDRRARRALSRRPGSRRSRIRSMSR
jgi:hypothetical protein